MQNNLFVTYLRMADVTRSPDDISFAYRTINDSITDMWAFWELKVFMMLTNDLKYNLWFCLQFATDWFESIPFRLWAYPRTQSQERLCVLTSVLLTSDLSFGSWDRSTNWTTSDSRAFHCPTPQLSAAWGVLGSRDRGRTVPSGCLARDC